ncbi:hypothetical protein AVEN_90374-1, partial [Araneus ventricosus]
RFLLSRGIRKRTILYPTAISTSNVIWIAAMRMEKVDGNVTDDEVSQAFKEVPQA